MPVIRPFDYAGVSRGGDGILRYERREPSLVAMLRASVDIYPENEAVVELGGGRLNYRQFWDRSARVAGGLRAAGIKRGDPVAIALGNGMDWCLAFFGIQLAGAIAVPVNTRFSEEEFQHVVEDSGSRYVFRPNVPLPDGGAMSVDDLTEGEVAAIFYTSGTTGFPKGAMITHENFIANAESCSRVLKPELDSTLRTLVSVPLFHVTGCNAQFLVACAFGGTTVVMPSFEIQAFLGAIASERISALTTVPAIYWLAIHQPNFRGVDTSKVTTVSYGGAPIAPDLVLKIVEAFPHARVGNGFGLTETAAMATYLPHEYSRLRPESVGFPTPVIDVRLGEMEPGGTVGELLIRGASVAKGYWKKPEATADTFAGGWLRTGDLARIDDEGFVQIVDRKKDMIDRGGENVYCVKVENVLAAHPAVFEVAVMGVPDVVMGEKVGAVVVPKPGGSIDVNELLEFAGSRLADFEVPQYVVIRAQMLPRNAGGKLLKKQLRATVEWGKQVGSRSTR